MANMTLRHLVDMAIQILQDEDYDGWSESDMVNLYGIASRDVVVAAPDANIVVSSVKLASGVRQSIPARAIELLRVIRNMGTDGKTAGAAVTPTTIELIQAHNRSWITATAAATIYNWMKGQGAEWFCYPPSDGTTYVEMERSEVPAAITWDDGDLWESAMVGVDDKYVNALLHNLLAWCYERDTDFPGSAELSGYHKNLFREAVGMPPSKRR